MVTILRVDSSANLDTSVTRGLTDRLIARFPDANVITRDVARDPLPQITGTWATARATPPAERTPEQHAALAQSDALVAELMDADILVLGAPVYNFSVPASLKAWIDLVARTGVTFRYTADGPQGLVRGKKAFVVTASGGTPVGSEFDFATGYLRHILGFIGITDVEVIASDRIAAAPDVSIREAHDRIDALTLAA